MADNVTADPGAGGVDFRTDEVSAGVHVPYTKLMDGTDGGTAVIPGDATNGLFVQVKASALPTGASTAAAQTTGNGHLATLAGAVSGTEMQVDIVASAAVPVTDNGGTLSVDDGGGALTVDGTVTVQDGGGAISVDDGAGSLTVDAPVGTPVFVRLSDGASAIATLPVSLAAVPSHAVTNAGTFATQVDGAALTALQLIDNLVLAEDAAHTTGDPGLMAFAVRRDANTSLVGTDGDYAPLQVNADGSLKVAITAGAGSGGTSIADDAAFTPASTSITPVGGTYRSTLDAVDDGDAGAFAMTANRGLHVNLRDASGAEVSVGGGTQYDEDTAHSSGDKLTMAGAVRRDSPVSGAGTDGDRATVNVDVAGRLWVNGSDVTQPVSAAALPLPTGAATAAAQATGNTSLATLAGAVAGTEVQVDVLTLPAIPAGNNNIGDVDIASIAAGDNNIGNVDIVTMPNVTLAAGTNTNEVVGDAAHDAAIAGNPIRIAGRGMSADYTAVASGDTADLLATLTGKQVNYPYALPGASWNYAAPAGGLVSTTAVTIKTAAGAGVRNYITSIQAINSHQTISTELTINDGAGGTVLWRGWLQAAGGGVACNFDPPLRGTANTLLEIDEISGTATAGILFNCQGFTAAE